MQGNRKRDTVPEWRVRRAMHALGLRYRVNLRLVLSPDVIVRPDIVFTRAKLAVFVDGCFWHGCPAHATQPRTNADYWQPKLRGNHERDARVDDALERAGWRVVRVWEHEQPHLAALLIQAELLELRGLLQSERSG
jgi:DNA mismatch endonuclease (patch repair protein)